MKPSDIPSFPGIITGGFRKIWFAPLCWQSDVLLEHYVILFAPQIREIDLVLELLLEVTYEEADFKKKQEREKSRKNIPPSPRAS